MNRRQMNRLACFALLALSLAPLTSYAQGKWCLWDPTPEGCGGSPNGGPNGPPGPGGAGGPSAGPGTPGGDTFSDPLTISGSLSFHIARDLSIDTPAGPFVLDRRYFSSSERWDQNLGSYGIPRPFGGQNVYWWHNLFTTIYYTGTGGDVFYVDESGNYHQFYRDRVPPSAGWLRPYYRQEVWLQSTATGFSTREQSGAFKEYAGKFVSGGRTYFLPTTIRNIHGVALASLVYGNPSANSPVVNCPQSSAVSGQVVPYIQTVNLAGGHQLRFLYAQFVSGQDCYLERVVYRAPGSGADVPMVQYRVSSSPLGRILGATVRGGLGASEVYEYGSNYFGVGFDGGLLFRHDSVATDAGPAPRVVSVNAYQNQANASVNIQVLQGTVTIPPLTTVGTSCYGSGSENNGWFLTSSEAGFSGDSSNTAATLQTAHTAGRNADMHRRVRLRSVDSCTATPEACSPGEQRWEPRAVLGQGPSCGGAAFARVGAFKDKRGSWMLTPHLVVDGGAGGPFVVARAGTSWGAYEDGGILVQPLETESLSYLARSGARIALETKTRPGAMSASVVTRFSYDDTDGGLRLKSEVTSGMTMESVSNWTQVTRHKGTFYRQVASDPLERLEKIEGPCWLDTAGSTVCSTTLNPTGGTPTAGWWPITKYEYYGSTSDSNSTRLLRTTRYPAGELGQVKLISEYSNYTPEGDPQKVRSYAVVSGVNSEMVDTDFTYSSRRPISQTVYRSSLPTPNAQTLWYYDEDQLVAVKYPEGNFEVACYRQTSTPFPTCTGVPTKNLKWRAKTSALTSFTWSERIEYTYDANGNQIEEQRFVFGDPNPRLRKRTHPDLHGRSTYSRMGDAPNGASFSSKAHFDGANNRDAIGPPANVPPDYCRSGSSDSPLCWWFRYDRANRLNRASAPGSPSLSRSCFDYNAAGSITRVTTGDPSLNCDPSLNTPGVVTTPTSTSSALQYGYDDFGNVIEVRNTGTDNNGDPPTQYRHDAQGNIVEKRTAAMATGNYQKLAYDGLGRLVRVTAETGSSTTPLYTLEYDTSAAPLFAATREFTFGQLARRDDSYGTTWYGYDYLGNVVSEFRERTLCNLAKAAHCRPHTNYVWDKNRSLKSITYPFGRVITYLYGSGASLDRPTSIKASVWLSGGGVKARSLVADIAWEPYGGLRGYTILGNDGTLRRSVEYYLGGDGEIEAPTGGCSATYTKQPDGSGRVRGLFVSEGSFAPSWTTHGSGSVFSQRYHWNEDQVAAQSTCLSGTEYAQSFTYDAMQRLTLDSMTNFPAFAGEVASESKVFDTRGNRIGGARDGYGVLDETFDPAARDRMSELCWWRGFLVPGECFVGYTYQHNSTGTTFRVKGIKGAGHAWEDLFSYPFSNALSDVYSVISRTTNGGGFVTVQEGFYDAFGRRRAKRNALGDAQEFIYDLSNQLLVDEVWTDSVSATTVDEYVWLGGRAVLVFRSALDSGGLHSPEFVDAPDTTGQCSRPMDDGTTVPCGLFHLVSNLQGFANIALWDWNGGVASFQLPDADGTVNQPRMMTFGGLGTSYAQKFDVPATFSKQARFRTSWTGPVPGFLGVTSFQLNGTTVLTPSGNEIGKAWSQWGPVVSGANDVTWSTTCGSWCSSASDMFEWKVWQTGAAQFHTKLRFPGQYYDAETDYHENWNRYYDPTVGRYLSTEPMLHRPNWVKGQLATGLQNPSYAYARGNPVTYTDPTGLYPLLRFFDPACTAFCEDARRIWPRRNGVPTAVCTTLSATGAYNVDAQGGVHFGGCACGGAWATPLSLTMQTGVWYRFGWPTGGGSRGTFGSGFN